MSLKPLGVVKEIVESAGMDLSYAYDDLVFVSHNAFLIQFTPKSSEFIVHVNKDADEAEVLKSIGLMNNAAAARDVAIQRGRYYTLVQADDENVRLEFMDTRE